eukprot:858011-Prymnesium_polylepis.1
MKHWQLLGIGSSLVLPIGPRTPIEASVDCPVIEPFERIQVVVGSLEMRADRVDAVANFHPAESTRWGCTRSVRSCCTWRRGRW